MIRRAILKRRAAERRSAAELVTAQTRWLYTAILSSAGVEDAAKRAEKIDLVPRASAAKRSAKPEPTAPSVEDAVRAFGQPEWGVEPDGD